MAWRRVINPEEYQKYESDPLVTRLIHERVALSGVIGAWAMDPTSEERTLAFDEAVPRLDAVNHLLHELHVDTNRLFPWQEISEADTVIERPQAA